MRSASDGRTAVEAYYSDLFCKPCEADLENRVSAVIADDWKCSPTPIGGDGAAGLADTLRFFSKFAPDLKYAPQEILQDGNRYVVRSVVTGTPTEPFFGVKPKGSFKINAIDIHEVVDGRIIRTHRIEDWARAIKQIAR